jgi:hypothetical protein
MREADHRQRRLRTPALLAAAAAILAAGLALAAEPKREPDPPDGRLDAIATDARAGGSRAPVPPPRAGSGRHPSAPRPPEIEWRRSRALGSPTAGSLARGVMLPAEGRSWVSWDPVERETPNRWWRRWGTDRLLRVTLAVVRAHATAHPGAPRVLIGDLSRPHGGDFGTRFGPIGHVSHQNGLDVDVYYPRVDGREKPPLRPDQVDVELAQELVDRFVAAGATSVFVGPSLPLTGPAGVVVPLVNHDNHLHARLPTP